MQMQREHTFCAPGVLDGVAGPLPEEILRTLQDTLHLHKTLRSLDALHAANDPLP